MADFTQIIQEINADINTNGVGAITGAKLNEVLRDIIAAVNAEKQDPLTIDATPTEDSTNPVQSGGVYEALDTKADKVPLATANDIATLGANGNLKDSGVSIGSVAMDAAVVHKSGDETISGEKTFADKTIFNNEIKLIDGNEIGATFYSSEEGKIEFYGSPSEGTVQLKHITSPSASSDAATKGYVDDEVAAKQDTISDLATIRSGAAAGATAYQKPSTGIPKTDLASGVQTSLGKADTAFQKPSGGIPESDLSSDVQQALQKHFKGWYVSSSALPANPVVGDYAYVKGAETTDPAAIYECTTAGTWTDSGRTADTSNVQTFASGEEVNEVHIVNNLTTGGVNDVLSAEQGKILQSKIGEEKTFPELMESYQYNLTDATYVSEFVIPQGSYIKKFRFKANAAGQGDRGIFFVRASDNVCIYKQVINIFQQGDNEVEINQVLNYDCRLCVRSLNLYYSSGGSVPASSVFSNKLWTSAPGFPDVGTAITITKNYSGNFALSVELEWDSGIIHEMNVFDNELDEAKGDIDSLEETVGSTIAIPTFVDSYPNTLTMANYVGDFIIPSNSYIDKLNFKVTDHTAQSDPGIFFLFRVSDNKCVYKQQFTYIQGDNEIKIDFKTTEDCKVGVYINYLSYVNSSALFDSSVWSMGLNQASPSNPNVGDTITISHLYSGKFALSLSLNIAEGLSGDYGYLANQVEDAKNDINILKNGTIYPHGAIISFIDDDCGKYVPSIWGEILQASPIRMGFACITGYMAGTETPPEIYEPMTLATLQSLYANGHEVYSHSYSHPAFYNTELTLEQVSLQCYKSKDWLLSQGFFRGVDILVYPGGLGENQTAKQAVVRQFYQYGVDTVGGTYNPEPLKPWTIYRKNADTATLQELKDAVDSAVANNGLLVFMNHAYQLNQDKVNQVAKMIDLIDYIKTTTAEILPLNEAIHKIYGWR